MLQLQQMINTEMQQHRSTPPPTRIAITPPLDAATTTNSQHETRASPADDTARVLRGLEQIDSTDAIAMSSLLALDALSSPAAVAAAADHTTRRRAQSPITVAVAICCGREESRR